MRRIFLIFGLCWMACLSGIAAASAQPPLKIKLSLDQPSFRQNSPIGVALLIYTGKDTEITFNSSQVYDLLLESNGKTVWQWSAGKMFAQSMVTKTITADNPLLYSIVIETVQIKPGKYTLTPVLCLSPGRITGEPVSFEIR